MQNWFREISKPENHLIFGRNIDFPVDMPLNRSIDIALHVSFILLVAPTVNPHHIPTTSLQWLLLQYRKPSPNHFMSGLWITLIYPEYVYIYIYFYQSWDNDPNWLWLIWSHVIPRSISHELGFSWWIAEVPILIYNLTIHKYLSRSLAILNGELIFPSFSVPILAVPNLGFRFLTYTCWKQDW